MMADGQAGAVDPVGHAMVEGQRERQQHPGHDLAFAHDRLEASTGDAENGDLGIVDDGNGPGAAEGTEIGDGARPSAQVVKGGLALADPRGQRGQLTSQLAEGLRGRRRG